MNKSRKIVVSIIIVLIIIVIVYMVAVANKNSNQTSLSASSSVVAKENSTQLQPEKAKFADSPDAQYGYLISIDKYDAKTQLALTGFNVSKVVLADGSQQITLTATNPEYKTQVYVVKPNQKLYFIERFLQDDKNGEEKNLKDDMAVLVDSDGYIIQ